MYTYLTCSYITIDISYLRGLLKRILEIRIGEYVYHNVHIFDILYAFFTMQHQTFDFVEGTRIHLCFLLLAITGAIQKILLTMACVLSYLYNTSLPF